MTVLAIDINSFGQREFRHKSCGKGLFRVKEFEKTVLIFAQTFAWTDVLDGVKDFLSIRSGFLLQSFKNVSLH